jgi:hypothetical protein
LQCAVPDFSVPLHKAPPEYENFTFPVGAALLFDDTAADSVTLSPGYGVAVLTDTAVVVV